MPNITETSELMDEVQFQALWSIIPSRFSIRDPKLLFSTTKHGFRYSLPPPPPPRTSARG
jgi:hypothetical protein